MYGKLQSLFFTVSDGDVLMHLIGFDIGGTKVEAMLIFIGKLKKEESFISSFEFQKSSGDIVPGYVLYKKRVATERHNGYVQLIDKMALLAKEVCAEKNVDLHSLSGIGLSVPGPVDPKSELVTSSNTMILVGHNLHQDLRDKLKVTFPIISENDANCFALAETLCGAGLDYFKKTGIPVNKQVSIGLILGSGFGGGIVVNGKAVTGRRGGAGEVGHMTLYPGGSPCYCGRAGCAEQYLCGPALEAALNNRIYSQIEKRPGAAEIFELYEAQDPTALAVVKRYKSDLAFFLGTLTCMLDPHYFVLGGGLSLQDVIYEGLEKKIGENTYLPEQAISIYKHKIGDSAGAIGAALVVLEQNNLHF
jgi:predicted NBD/HSP70 family sugar kinase